MRDRPTVLVRLALAVVRLARLIVPSRERDAWRREWESEIRYHHGTAPRQQPRWNDQLTVLQRSLGSVSDAAWLRRQFTRDSELMRDLRTSVRMASRRPGFFLVAALVLAAGIGSTTAVFSAAEAVLLRPLPFPDADRVVAIWQDDTTDGVFRRGEIAPGNFLNWRAGTSTFAAMASAEPFSMDYTGGDRPEALFATRVSEGFFDVLQIQPVHGRFFSAADHVTGASPVAIVGESLWARRFGSDPNLVGRTIPLDGVPHTVVGIVPELGLDLLDAPARRTLWLPKIFEEYETRLRGDGWWATIGRIRADVTIDQAQADLDVVSARLARDFPSTNATMRAVVEPIAEHLVGDARPALGLLLVAVLAVLLVGCANVANMTAARAADRDREFTVRSALGAGRGRLVRQVLAESIFVSSAGALAGLLAGAWLIDLVKAAAPADLPRLADATINWRVAFVAASLGVFSGVLAGLVPALQLSRPAVADMLAAGRSATTSRRGRAMRDGLVVAEVAMAVALVMSAGLLLRSFATLIGVDPGFRTGRVLALQVFAWDRENRDPARRASFFRDTLESLEALPGVTGVGAVSAMPFIGANINIQGSFTIDGRPVRRLEEQDQANFTVATPGYFSVMGIPVVSGRGLTPEDDGRVERVAVVSEALARRHWPDGSPVGAVVNFRFAGTPVRARVVGVVGELRHDGLDRPPREEVFLPHAQLPYGSMTYVIQTRQDPRTVVDAAEKAIWAHDPLLAFYDTATVDELLSSSVAPRRFSLALVAGFAIVALVLAAAGIYGVLSFITSRRTREFGVRMAMGATGSEIARLVIRRGLRLSTMGLVLGLGISLAAGRTLEAHLFGIRPSDPLTIAAVAALVLATSVAACWVPAKRAMRVDPLEALREV